MHTERRTEIMAIRIDPTSKKRFLEEAQKRGETLTDFLIKLLGAGWGIIVKQNKSESVKQ